MKAVVMRVYGTADVLEIQEIDKPVVSNNLRNQVTTLRPFRTN